MKNREEKARSTILYIARDSKGLCDTISEMAEKEQEDHVWCVAADMEFVQNFTSPDFQAKNFIPSISQNFNSFNKKKHKKSE